MRVLHLLTHLEHGGLETWLLDMLEIIDRNQCAMDFSCKGSRVGSLASQAQQYGADVYWNPLMPDQIRYSLSLTHLIRAGNYDLVHIHTGVYAGLGVWSARRAGVPTITTFHSTKLAAQATWTRMIGVHQLRSIYAYLSVSYALARSNMVTATSEATLSGLSPGWQDRDYWHVLRLGVRFADKATDVDRRQFRRSLDFSPNAKILVHIGSFREAKNHPAVIAIYEKVRTMLNSTPIGLVLIGDGKDRQKIEQLVARSDDRDAVRFLGVRKDALQIMACCDVCIMPSRYEGFGRVAVEANGCGLPVIGSNRDGLREAVIDGQTGFLFEPDDIDSMASAVACLLTNRTKYAEVSHQAIRRAQEGFSLRSSADGLLDAYHECLSTHAKKA